MKIKLLLIIAMFLLVFFLNPIDTKATLLYIGNITATNGTDVRISEGGPDTNFGTFATVIIGKDISPVIERTLLNISICLRDGKIPASSTINSFNLQVYVTDTIPAIEDLEFFPVKTAWVENTITWNGFNTGGVNMTDYNGTLNLIDSWTPATPLINNYANITINTYYAQRLLDGQLGDWDEGLIAIHGVSEAGQLDNAAFASSDATALSQIWSCWVDYTEAPAGDTTSPKINTTFNITTIRINNVVNLSANVTDETGLSFCQAIINQTGIKEYYNISVSGTSVQCSQNFTINQIRGNVINFTMRVNDTSNNWAMNDTIITIANTQPTITSIVGGAKEPEPYNSSLVAYWDMDERNGNYILDRTSNDHDGLVVSANRSYGKLGYGMVFDGNNDYVTVPDSNGFSFGDGSTDSPFSVSLWAKLIDTSSVALVTKEGTIAVGDNIEWKLYTTTGSRLELRLWDSSSGARIASYSSSTIPASQWVFLVATYNGNSATSGIKVYLNGASAGDNGQSDGVYIAMENKGANVVIGATATAESDFTGEIDEVKIWGVELSASEIANLYSQGMGTGSITTQTPLSVAVNVSSDADNDVLFTAVDWWKGVELNATTGKPDDNATVLFYTFDKKSTTTIEDYSIKNNTGTINGATFSNDSAMGLGAYVFDGVDDYINVSHSLFGNSPYTVNTWFKNDNNNGSSKTVLESENFAMSIYASYSSFGGNLTIFAQRDTANANVDLGIITQNNTWYMITSVWDGTTLSAYLDGELIGTGSQGSGNLKSHTFLHIGTRRDVSGFFSGTIDEVRIYNRSLSVTEISQHYEAGKRKGLTLNQSQTKKNEKWNATITLYDDSTDKSVPINFSFAKIGNIAPNGTGFINASPDSDNKNITLNVTASYDIDAEEGIDTLYYLFYINTTASGNFVLSSNSTKLNITTNATTDGVYGIRVNVTDLEVITEGNEFIFVLDTTIPTIPNDNITILNNTYISGNRTIFIEATDPDIYNSSLNLSQGGITYEIYYNDTPDSSKLGFSRKLNLTGLNDGKYNITFEAVDQTSEAIDQNSVKKGKKGETILIFNDTSLKKELIMEISFAEKDDKPTDTPADIKTSFEYDERNYLIWQTNFTVAKPETTILYNVQTNGDEIRILNTDYLAHLLFGDDYGGNFNGTFLINEKETDFRAIVTRISKTQVQVQVIPDTPLKVNDVVSYTAKSLYGLNHIIRYSQLNVDNSPPLITNIKFFALNSSQNLFGFQNESDFNLSNLQQIEFMVINFTVTDNASIANDMSLFYTANETDGCALGNNQSITCLKYPTFIKFKNNTNLQYYSDFGSAGRGDSITCTFNANSGDTQRNYSCIIDEHYNPNVWKHYPLNFSNTKWQNGVQQRISQGDIWRIDVNHSLIPANATFYKLDARINYTVNEPTTPITAFACNSLYKDNLGDPETSNYCSFIASKLPDDFQDDGTKFRAVFGKNFTQALGNLSVILFTSDTIPSRYYYMKTYKFLGNDGIRSKFSIDSGSSYTALSDGYESEINLNWFFNTTGDATKILVKIGINDSIGNNENTSVSIMQWNLGIEGVNFNPIIDIITPEINTNLSGTTNLSAIVADSDGNTLISNISVYNGTRTFIFINIPQDNTSIDWDTTSLGDGFYNLTWRACENDTTDILCGNETHQIFIDNTAPIITLINPINGTTTTNTNINFTWNVTDDLNVNCTMDYNNLFLFNQTNIAPTVYSNQTSLNIGSYRWTVNCTDSTGNNRAVFNLLSISGAKASKFTSGAEAGTTILASETTSMNKKLCEASSGVVWFEDTCYNCNGWIEKEGGDIVCKSCNEGFTRLGNQCISTVQTGNILDKYLNKYFPDNPMFGFTLIVIVAVVGFIMFNNRGEIIENAKKFKRKYIYD